MDALAVPLSAAAALQPTSTSFINSRFQSVSFNQLKTTFNMYQEATDLLNQLHSTRFVENENGTDRLEVSTTDIIAVLFIIIHRRLNEFMNLIDNDDLTDNLRFHLNRLDRLTLLQPESTRFNLLHSRGFDNAFYAYLEFIKLVYKATRKVSQRKTNRFKNPVYLKTVIAAHELFDSFKRALTDYLDDFHGGFIDDFEFDDVDYRPRMRIKKCIIPRQVNINQLLKNFIYEDLNYHYSHQIQDLQEMEFEPFNFNGTLDQVLTNLINDVNYYIRFFPTNWIDGSLTPAHFLENNGFHLHSNNNTLKSILKKYNIE